MTTEPINLLWTGGYDSSYRLLHLVLVEGRPVRPYYVIDTGRRSTAYELDAMTAISEGVAARDPEAGRRIEPTVYVRKRAIAPHPEITAMFWKMREHFQIGTQYDWLARMAEERRLDDLELCIDKGSNDAFSRYMTVNFVGQGHECRLRPDPRPPEMALFRRFRFPVYEYSKSRVLDEARQSGFGDLIALAWFCHTPSADGLPCGECHPCRQTKASGVSFEQARHSLPHRVRVETIHWLREHKRAAVRAWKHRRPPATGS